MKYQITLSAALLSILPLGAQQTPIPSTSNTITKLPEMTVTANRQNPSLTSPSVDAAKTELARTAGNSAVVDADEFRLGKSATFEDVFKAVPGIYAPARGSEGDEVKLSIRGSALDLGFHLRGIKLLQDGVPISFADGFGDFQMIDPLSVRYLEVWRGSNALRYGSTTLGGAINFVSPTGHDSPAFRARFETGSYGYYNGQISSGGVSGPWDYYVSGTFMSRDSFQEHSEMDSQRFYGNLGYRFNDDLETRFFISYARSRTKLPGSLTKDEIEDSPRAADQDAIDFDQGRDIDWVRLANKTILNLDGDNRVEGSVYASHYVLDHPLFWNPYFLNGLGVRHGTYNSVGGEFRYISDEERFGQKNRLTLGFAPSATFLHDERLANDYGDRGSHVGDGETTSANYDFYAENQHYLTDKLSLITGSSFSYAVRNFDDDFLSDPNGDQSRDQDYYGFSPKLGLLYELNSYNQLFTNVSRSFEPPSSVELVGLGGSNGDVLTKNLSAQTATTFEVGTRGEEGRFKWEMAYYYSWLRNELLTVNDADGNPLGTINGPHTHHQGIELGVDSLLFGTKAEQPGKVEGHTVTLKQILNWNDFKFDDSDAYGDNRLAGAPEFWYRAELVYENSLGFYAGPNVQWASKTAADYANTLYADSYAILGLRAGYRSTKGWSVFAEVRNLTDKHYATSAEPIPDAGGDTASTRVFRPGEPRSFYTGVEWSF